MPAFPSECRTAAAKLKRRCARAAAVLGILSGAPLAVAAPPDLKHIFPPAVQAGKSSLISIGKVEGWPQLWASTPGVTFTPTPKPGTYNVEVAADAKPGAHLIRAWNDEGASTPRALIISSEPELRSIEPNDSPKAPQRMEALPASISGRLEKGGDVDVFSVSLKKGQVLVASVQSHVLASTLDPLIRVTDAAGRVLGFNHDSRTIDPFLAWEAPADGTFYVQVMGFAYPAQASVQLMGGEECVYRLLLSTRPTVRSTAPAAVQAGTKRSLHLIGWNLPAQKKDFDASAPSAGETVEHPFGNELQLLAPLRVSETPEIVEDERKDAGEPLALPAAVTGRIRAAGEEDRYPFLAVKGRAYEMSVEAAKLGSNLDAWIALQNADGKEVARNDDSTGRDPRVKWTAPADGVFTAAVGDLTHRGGDDFVYRLLMTEAAPQASATSAAHAFAVTAGGSAEIKVAVTRSNGFKAALQVVAKELPRGVTATEVDVPEKDGEVMLKLTAEAAATPSNLPIRLALREKESGREYSVIHQLTATSENNGVPQGYAELAVEKTDQLWLTVIPVKAAK